MRLLEGIKKYWDLIGGAIVGLLLAVVADFDLDLVQLYYSVIILVLVSIGILRLFRQEIEKRSKRKERKHTIVDDLVDSQKIFKAMNLSQAPEKEGEKVGKAIIIIFGGIEKMMEKLKIFFDKFKGYLLTIALALLTVIEMCGGVINSALGGALTVNGVEILPVVTLVLTAVVGIISNGFTTDQKEKIKALFSKSTTNEIVKEEIKKTIKEKTALLSQNNKILTTQEHALANLESELATAENTLQAKKEMFAMRPQLATDEDVRIAAYAVQECKDKIKAKKDEIAATKATIENLTTNINALKSQL